MPNEIIEITLDQVLLNDRNPRGFIDPETVKALSASMAVEGQKTAIKVLHLDTAQYRVVGGDHRVLAARALGWTTIKAEVLAITPDQAYLEGYLDNQNKPMGWFADYMAVEVLWKQTDGKKGSQKPIAARLMKSETVVSTALKLMPLLNAYSREAILRLAKNAGNEKITQKAILALTRLGDPQKVEEALKVVIDRKMTEKQAKALVASMLAGHPADLPIPGSVSPESSPTGEASTPVKAAPQAQSASQKPAATMPASHPHPPSSPAQTTSPAGISSPMGTPETLLWDAAAGISVITHIKAKIKKGERPTWGEGILLGLYRFFEAMVWAGKHILIPLLKFAGKTAKAFIKEFWKLFKEVIGRHVLRVVSQIAFIIFLVLAIWLGAALYFHKPYWPYEYAKGKVMGWFSKPTVESITPPAPLPTPEPTAIMTNERRTSKNDTPSPRHASLPTGESRSVVSFPSVQYDPGASTSGASSSGILPSAQPESPHQLEAEIKALPDDARVKEFSFEPDNTMGAAMAERRLQDLTDGEKFTLFVDHDAQHVLTVTPTSTNLTLTYQGGVLGGVGGLFGPSKMDFYWEDVETLHCSQIEIVKPHTASTLVYQLGIVINNTKRPLTVQCATVNNLTHLVAAIEYWLKASRGHGAPLASLPYLNQGLWLKGDNQVSVLWANSPADKAGFQFDDYFWSIGKNSLDAQHKAAFEKALQSPGNIFYVVSPADWEKAKGFQPNGSPMFNPKRHKVTVAPSS